MIRTREETLCDFCGMVNEHCVSTRISVNDYDVCPACMEDYWQL